MDRQSTVVIVVCMLLIGLWYFVLVPKLYPPGPLPPASTNAPGLAEPPAGPGPASPAVPTPVEAPSPALALVLNTNEPERLVQVGNANARYTFTSYGGGLKLVELYLETDSTGRAKGPSTNQAATLNTYTLAPTLALLDGVAVQGDGIFKLTPTTNGVRAEKTLTNGLSIVKDFELSSNYLVAASVRLENHSDRPLELPAQEWFVGTATPMDARDSGMAVGVLWYNGAKTVDTGPSYFSSRGFACTPRIPPSEYVGGSSNVVWVAAHNQYFTLAAMPQQQPAPAVVVRKVQLPRRSAEEVAPVATNALQSWLRSIGIITAGEAAALVATNAPPPEGYEAAMLYPGQTLAPNQALERRVFLYAGPKEYQRLARIGERFGNDLDKVMALGWAGFVSKALLLGMNWLHHVLRVSYGGAVVAITITIKLVFWPLTQASTRSMKRMQALQPQVKVIQEKFKDDPVKMQRKMMELWKEHKVSPMSGCFPMMIQIPVFFGFYSMISSAIELRGARFLWVADLAKPDTLFVVRWLSFVPFLSIPGVGLPFNLLPLIMGGTMLWQTHLTPPSPGMDPTQAKLMRYLPLIFMVTLYNLSSGLTLYWTVNNLLSIAQTKLTKTTSESTSPAKGPPLTPAPKKRK
jgi:YidC/Oxa1 family membrane protein insertase